MSRDEDMRETEVFYDHANGNGDVNLGHSTVGGYVYGVTRVRYEACDRYGCSPRVVIDPDDPEQVGRLTASFAAHYHGLSATVASCASMQAALCSLIAPPRPPEPTGLGAVVEVANGDLYIRDKTTTTVAHWKRARGEDGGARYKYADLAVVEVKSQGWSA